mgnify:CR=1 FL=1
MGRKIWRKKIWPKKTPAKGGFFWRKPGGFRVLGPGNTVWETSRQQKRLSFSKMVWKVSLFLTICLSLGHTLRPKGVRPDFASFYDPNSAFHCLDGSAEIPFDQVNDDYCDCKVRIFREITQVTGDLAQWYCDFTRFFFRKIHLN